jgi:hypothetical protein
MEEYFQSTMGSDKDAREERQLQVSRSATMLMILFVGERQMARAFEGGERFDVAPSR